MSPAKRGGSAKGRRSGSGRRSRSGGRGRRAGSGRGAGLARWVPRVGAVLVLAGAVVVAARATDAGPAEVDVAPDPGRWTQGRVRVEVLNAGELSGMARIATERLRDAGFDVVDYRNADRFDHARPSEVVDRVGRTDAARAVAEALGIGIVHSDPDPNLYVDVSVVLGRDWTGAEPDPVETVQDSPPWWNPRSWTKR